MTSVPREAVVSEARSWLGTPFRHQGRLKGVGCDCAGLVIMVARSLGLGEVDVTGYGRLPDSGTVGRLLAGHMTRKAVADALPGDVLQLAAPLSPCHLAIVGERHRLTLIHAYGPAGRVVEHDLDEHWRSRARGCFAYPGIL